MAASSRCHVIELRLFGGLDLRRSDGRELDSILTQPKRVALLAFLATATSYRLHRRDTLLGLFWPELDQEHARAALRQALHGLRQGLGADVLTSRGDEETLRRLVALLDDLGDRGGAVRVYEGFARRVAGEYQVEPAAETKALITLVRSRGAASPPVLRPAPPSFTAPPAAAERPSAASIEPAARRFTLPGKRWVVGTIGLALLAAVMAIRHQQASARLSQVSVGIVPFEDRSEDTLDAYLGSALTEDLSRSLSAAHVLRVFRVRQARPGLDYILTGSVRHAKDTLDVTAQLERNGSGEIVWATRLALRSRGAITVPRTLTSEVLRALGARAGAPTERPTLAPDPVAYDLFLRGRYEASRRCAPSLGRAVALFSESIRKDSTLAPGWAGLARVLHNANRWGFPVRGVPPESLLTREIFASDRALELDSTSVDAWLTRAKVSDDVDPTSRGPALRAIGRALALDSLNAEAWDQLAMALEEVGRRDSAGAAWHRAIALDPGRLEALAFLGIHYWW